MLTAIEGHTAIFTVPTKTQSRPSSWLERIDIARFLAICSVVWGHCQLGLEHKVFSGSLFSLGQSASLQAGRVGTVMFFLISGFLIGSKIEQFSALGYLRYRLHSLIIPWLIFVLLLVALQIYDEYSMHHLVGAKVSTLFLLMGGLLKGSVFHAAYWFVPVALVSVIVLILCKKWLNKWWLGALLASISVFYGINLYFDFVPSSHTQAFLGYAFYAWLGQQMRMHALFVNRMVHKMSWRWLRLCLVVLTVLACCEGMLLTHRGCEDAYASIRISNAALSIALFVCLMKSQGLVAIKRLHPQRYTYGLYLIHSIVISEAMPFLLSLQDRYLQFADLRYVFVLQVALFIVVMSISLVLTMAIRKSSFKWIIGAR